VPNAYCSRSGFLEEMRPWYLVNCSSDEIVLDDIDCRFFRVCADVQRPMSLRKSQNFTPSTQ